MNLEKEVFEISLNDIMPNRFQPREIFDEQELSELAKSINEHGIIQPIIVRKVGDKYEIIAGERRYRASLLAGKATIPALVRDIDDKETAKIALLENLQRSNLTPIEEAKTYQTILKLDNITQEELANNLGKSQSTVANKLRLLNLDEEVQTALLNKQISERHARSLLNITDLEMQKKLLNKVIINRMTVKQLDDEIMALTGKMPAEIVNENLSNNQPSQSETAIKEFSATDQNIQENNTQTIIDENNSQPVKPEISIGEAIPENNNLELGQSNISEEPIIQPIEENNENPIQTNIFSMLRNKSEEPDIAINKSVSPETDESKNEKQSIIPKVNAVNISENISEEPIIQPIEEVMIPNGLELPENKQINEPNESSQVEQSTNKYNEVYDLRFAINNIRQAIQNTEKFGFMMESQEFDLDNIYQIIIKIDKNKTPKF